MHTFRAYPVLFLLAAILLIFTAGCGEEEDYHIETDQEFQQAVEEIVKQALRGENYDAALEQLLEDYSGRYSEKEVEDYLLSRIEEEEDYHIETDQEFQQAIDEIVKQAFRGEDFDAALDQLLEDYSGRYSEKEAEDYLLSKIEEEESKLLSRINAVEQRTYELEALSDQYFDELERVADAATAQEVEQKIDIFIARVEELETKIEQTENTYEMVEMLEEMEQVLEEMVSLLENALETAGAAPLDQVEDHARVKEDLENYLAVIDPLFQLEDKIVQDYASVRGADDETFQLMLEENVIPESRELLEKLNSVRPETEAVSQLHSMFIEGWELQRDAFLILEEALIETDQTKRDAKAEEGNLLLDEAIRVFDQFGDEFVRLLAQYNLDF